MLSEPGKINGMPIVRIMRGVQVLRLPRNVRDPRVPRLIRTRSNSRRLHHFLLRSRILNKIMNS